MTNLQLTALGLWLLIVSGLGLLGKSYLLTTYVSQGRSRDEAERYHSRIVKGFAIAGAGALCASIVWGVLG